MKTAKPLFRVLRQFFFWCSSQIHPSWQVYAVICGFLFGLVFCLTFNYFWSTSNLWLVVAVLLILFSIIISRRFLAIFAIIAGIIIANFRIAPELTSRLYFASIAGGEITVIGQISEDPDTSEGKNVIRLVHLKLLDENGDPGSELSGTLYVQLSSQTTDLMRSDLVTLKGKLNAGFGTFVGIMYRPEILNVERAIPGDIFAVIKQNFATAARENIPSPEVDLGLGYLMGMKNGLSEDFSNTLRLVGMTHVIVASGAHLGIIVSLAKKIFGRLSKFAESLFALLTITTFVLIVGFTPSMTRAALVSSLSLLVGYVGRKFTPLRLLLLVAAITLTLNPLYLFNLGWQLSFASFFGLLIILPCLQQQFYGGKTPPWLASMLLTSLSTTLVCAPILIYSYGTFSLLSFIANLVILPTLPYAMLLVFLAGAVSFLPFLASIFGKLAALLLDLHIFVINFLSEKTTFIFHLPSNNPQVFLIYLLLLSYLLFPQCFCRFRKKYAIIKSRCKLIPRTK